MTKKHTQHKVTYCCDQGLSFFTAELNEAVEHGFKKGILSERDRIIEIFDTEGALDSCFEGDAISVPKLVSLIGGWR